MWTWAGKRRQAAGLAPGASLAWAWRAAASDLEGRLAVPLDVGAQLSVADRFRDQVHLESGQSLDPALQRAQPNLGLRVQHSGKFHIVIESNVAACDGTEQRLGV